MCHNCRPLFVVFLSLVIGLFLGPKAVLSAEKLLIFGRVQEDPVKAIRDRQAFVDYIGKKLVPLGFKGAKIFVVDKLHLLARALKEGRVDFFHDSVVPTLVLSRWTGSIPILRQWKFNEAEYHSVIIVRKNSGINSLNDLVGKVIAFDEPHSTSAHILPRMLLAERKLKLDQVVTPAGGKPNVVGFIHTTDGNAPHLLINGKVDAAGTSQREFEGLPPYVRTNLNVVATTKSVPRLLISVRNDLDAKIVSALKNVMLNMDKDPEGQVALKKQQKTTKIDEIPPGSHKPLKEIEKFLFSTLEREIDSW